jgi:hypothetical protein
MLETELLLPLDSEKSAHFLAGLPKPPSVMRVQIAAVSESAALRMLCCGWLGHRRVQPHSKCQQLINA